jgi:hypothetical protein
LYTFSKRTAPFAAYSVFDGPTGETCVAERNRSNTPLQALTLLNDEMFLEMARAMAKQTLEIPSASETAKATRLFRRVVTRPPTEDELAAIVSFQQAQLKRLSAGELQSAKIGKNKQATPEFASWVMVARALINLDETITKP